MTTKQLFERITEMWVFLAFLAFTSLAAITYIAQDLGQFDKAVMWWAVSGPIVFCYFLIRKKKLFKVTA